MHLIYLDRTFVFDNTFDINNKTVDTIYGRDVDLSRFLHKVSHYYLSIHIFYKILIFSCLPSFIHVNVICEVVVCYSALLSLCSISSQSRHRRLKSNQHALNFKSEHRRCAPRYVVTLL